MDKKLKQLIDKIEDSSYESRYINLYDIQNISVEYFIEKIKEKSKDLINPLLVFYNIGYEDGYTSIRIDGLRKKTIEEIEKEKELIILNYNKDEERKKELKEKQKEHELRELARLKKKYE